MPKLVPIVEGVGETTAVPVLLYKVMASMNRYDIQVATPKNAHGRDNLTKAGGLERFVTLACMERDCGAVVVLLDVEEGCGLALVKALVARIGGGYAARPVVIVAANRMYENWILASLETVCGNDLEGRAGLPSDTVRPSDAEAENGKVYLNTQFQKMYKGRAYKETEDQEAMTRLIDLDLAKANSRSFRRLCHAVEEAIGFIDAGQQGVTPTFAEESPVNAPPPTNKKKAKKTK